MKKLSALLGLLLGVLYAYAAEPFITFKKTEGAFPVVGNGQPCTILVDKNENSAILIAVKNLQEDFLRVTGKKAETVNTPSDGRYILVGSIESPFIKQLFKAGKLNRKDLEGKNEKYVIQTVDQPLEEFKTVIWQGTPYGNTGNILEKTIPTITHKDVTEYYNGLFYPENLVISVNGNVNDNEIISAITNIFCVDKQVNVQKFDYNTYKNVFKPLNTTKKVTKAKDVQAAWIVMGWLTDGVENKKDVATLQVIDSILGGGMSSRLFNRLRDEQGLAYQVGSSFAANVNKGIFALYIGTNPATAQHSKNELLKQVNLLKKEFVSDRELQEAKDKILGNFILSQETNMEKASTLGWFELSGRGFGYINEFPQLVKSVTATDIIRVANKYFEQPYVYSVVAPQNCLKKIK